MSFATVPEILEEIRAGRMVVIVDDEDRENEGDLIMAAEKVRPEDVNFMVREGRGLVCLPLTQAHCRQLGLKPMVDRNTSPHHTNFTVVDRSGGRRHDRHLRVRPRAHDPHGRSAQRAARRHRAARPHLPARCAAGRRARARGPHRSRRRSRRACGPRAGWRARRDPERRRHDGAPSRARSIRREARPQDRHDRRPDPLPPRNREDRRARA